MPTSSAFAPSSDEFAQEHPLLVEIAWEVCNQVGGIYTVIRSKVPSMMERWDEDYCLVGPFFPNQAASEFEPTENFDPDDPYAKATMALKARGINIHYGHWLVTGSPRVVLIDPYSAWNDRHDIRAGLWSDHGIPTPDGDNLIDQVQCFGHLLTQWLIALEEAKNPNRRHILHFHEWMVGMPIPALRKRGTSAAIIFTTHATMLGRYLAMNDAAFYDHLTTIDWLKEARHFGIETQVRTERAAAHGAHVFSTVSEVTVRECIYLLDRIPDIVMPNGLNIQRFTALHEFQNLHLRFKEKIHQFVMAHFFQSYPFDLDKTLYFFTSGRYEYQNKGFDLTLEALARLNYRMQQAGVETTVVMFFVTKAPVKSVNPDVLHSRAVMEEIRESVEAITKEVKEKLFYAAAASTDFRLPNLNEFVDDYWKLRYRRTLTSWKTHRLPPVVTHNLVNEDDPILNYLRGANLVNHAHDRVKVVYHPDFISPTSPLFGLEYGQFVRGCHLGIFPSYYEPWGYTPLECIARGVPTVTSDLAGFGDYVMQHVEDHDSKGTYVVNRRDKGFEESAQQLADMLFDFVQLTRRERINQRNRVESSSEMFDWKNLRQHYDRAAALALELAGQ
jgi:glycogen synthase